MLEAIDYFLSGISHAFTWYNMLLILVGMLLGTFLGALPGIGPPLAVALLLPMVFGMDPIPALMLILGVYNGGVYGGSITAILINTPGTAGSAATTIDGYPMAQKGQAGMALGAALSASVVGGLISSVIFILVALPFGKFTLKFGPSELFLLILVALATVSRLAGKYPIKGLIATGIGCLLAYIGFDRITGFTRFDFGIRLLEDGLDLLVVLIGWFAVTEVMFLVSRKTETISTTGLEKGGILKGVLQVFRYPKNLLTSSAIGAFVGAVPGIGMAIANFVAYATAKDGSKHPEKFGTGYIEGVIAPEASNNAVTGTSLIPTLVLGIPGNPTTAVMLGALMILGLRPGVGLFTTRPEIMSSMMVGLIIIQFAMLLTGLLTLRYYQMVTKVNIAVLSPIIIAVSFVGAFIARYNCYDLLIAVILGLLAYGMRKAEYPVVCAVLGFVLASELEVNYHRALMASRGNLGTFFGSPICTVIIALGLLVYLWPLMKRLMLKLRTSGS